MYPLDGGQSWRLACLTHTPHSCLEPYSTFPRVLFYTFSSFSNVSVKEFSSFSLLLWAAAVPFTSTSWSLNICF